MPCCTYLNSREATAPVADAELQKLLEQVRAATGRDYRLEEKRYLYTTGLLWWRKQRERVGYYLYIGVNEVEFQIANFYRGEGETTLPGAWDCTAISAYFYGVLTGKAAA